MSFWKTVAIVSFWAIFLGVGTGVCEEDAWSPEPDGMFCPTPVMSRSCVAVRVHLTDTQALQGIRWYHNDAATEFPKILVASGLKDLPPLFIDGVVAKENVGGVEADWSEISFSQPLASQTGSLFVIFQLPANTEGVDWGEGPGFGYISCEAGSSVYLSPDGDDWTRLKTTNQLLVDPVYIHRDPGTVALKSFSGNGGDENGYVPLKIEKTELFAPYPNPFNPMASIAFNLKNEGPVKLTIYDIRGRLVAELENGVLATGYHKYTWAGVDRGGRGVASGVYFAKLKADSKEFVDRMVLIK